MCSVAAVGTCACKLVKGSMDSGAVLHVYGYRRLGNFHVKNNLRKNFSC